MACMIFGDLWVGGWWWWGWEIFADIADFWYGDEEPGTTATTPQPVLDGVCFRPG